MFVSCPSGHTDRQTKHARILTVGFVEETMTAQLALRCIRPRVTRNDLRPLSKTQGREVEVLSISADNDCIRTHLLDSIHTVRQCHALRVAATPIHDEEIRGVRVL